MYVFNDHNLKALQIRYDMVLLLRIGSHCRVQGFLNMFLSLTIVKLTLQQTSALFRSQKTHTKKVMRPNGIHEFLWTE